MPLEVTAATHCGEDRNLHRGGVPTGGDRDPTPMALSAYPSEHYCFYVERRNPAPIYTLLPDSDRTSNVTDHRLNESHEGKTSFAVLDLAECG